MLNKPYIFHKHISFLLKKSPSDRNFPPQTPVLEQLDMNNFKVPYI